MGGLHSPRMRERVEKIRRHWLRNSIAIILLAIGLAFFVGWWMVRRSLPKTHGVTAVAGLKAPVRVDRDRWGVPYIQAQSLGDLAMAQGYTTAQDRLWQMDTLRRAAAGELSEIFGPLPAVEALDRENRTLGIRAAAEDAAQHMDPETRLIVEAYAAGVNRCIEEQHGKLPLEFMLLGYEPRPWTPVDTFLIDAFMWKTLTTTWRAKINRAKLTDIVGPDRARDLFVTDSPLDHFIVGGEAPAPAAPPVAPGLHLHLPKPGNQITAPTSQLDPTGHLKRRRANSQSGEWEGAMWENASGMLRAFDDETVHISGSNNWVVSGAHTATGKPLLANDTHLGLDVPDIWYTVHLKAPEWNVQGFALPGVPLVIIGHNQRIAWGFTNSNADVQDVYQEKFDSQDPTLYLDHGKWVHAQVRPEVIHIKGEADQTENVVVTRHGPIVARDPDEQRGYALRWTLTEPGGMDFGYPMLGHAQNWNDFLEVMRLVHGPGQNAVYADVDGNIGWIIAAQIPIRGKATGGLPTPGDGDDYDWKGYIPFDELPKVLNPPEGIIATANARTVGPGYKYYVSSRWAAPYRTDRIYQLLTGRTDLTVADCNAIQTDIVSEPDLFLAQELSKASKERQPAEPHAREVLSRLARWDGRATSNSLETSLVEYTRHALMRNLLTPFVGESSVPYDLWEPENHYGEVWWRDGVFLENVLRDRPKAWLPEGYKDYDDLLIASADEAIGQIQGETGSKDAGMWIWGRMHPIEIDHPMARSGILQRILSLGPLRGYGTVDTVDAIGHQHGPAMRFVADLSNFDNSLMEITTGESGQYGSAHYHDQFPEWLAGRGIPARFSDDAEQRASVEHLDLVPVGGAGAN